jgi:nucleoside-diphosphate-sugar epimerase
VIHLAAYYDFSGEPSPLYRELTVEGTRRLLRGVKDFECEQLLFSSSLLVMQPAEPGEVITESSPTRAEWAYPASKLEAEEVLRREHGALPVVILRIAGVYDDDGHSLPIGRQIHRIREKKLESFVFPGDATHGQPYVHLDDLAACVRLAVEKRKDLEPFEVFLIAEPDVMSQTELQEQIGLLVHGRAWPSVRIPRTVAKIGAWLKGKVKGEESTFIKPWMIDLADDHYPVAIEKARRVLDWRPSRRLRDTLPTIVGRMADDPKRWHEINDLPPPSDGREAVTDEARQTERT